MYLQKNTFYKQIKKFVLPELGDAYIGTYSMISMYPIILSIMQWHYEFITFSLFKFHVELWVYCLITACHYTTHV